MYTHNKLMIATIFITAGTWINAGAISYEAWLDELHSSRKEYFKWLETVNDLQRECAWMRRAIGQRCKQPIQIQDTITTKDGKKYLKIAIEGIAKPEEKPRTEIKSNSLSITTETGSFSIEQNNGTIQLNTLYNLSTQHSNQSCAKTKIVSDEQLGKIQFREVTNFDVTSKGSKTTIVLNLPLKAHESVTTTYSFDTPEIRNAESAPTTPIVADTRISTEK